MGILQKLKKTFLPSAEEGARRRLRTFGTVAKTPAVVAGLTAGASVTPAGRAVIGAIGRTYVGKKLGLGLLGASTFSAIKSFASTGSINPVPSAKQFVYATGLAFNKYAGGLGIIAGESLHYGKKAIEFFKDPVIPFVEKNIIDPSVDYVASGEARSDAQVLKEFALKQYETGSEYASRVYQGAVGAVGSYFPSIPVNVGGGIDIRGLEGLGGLGSGALESLKDFAKIMGISLVALLAYLGIKKARKKKKSKKRGRSNK